MEKAKQERANMLAKILCPFCSAPWTDEMLELYTESEGYESTGYYDEPHIKITCKSCNKLIYEK